MTVFSLCSVERRLAGNSASKRREDGMADLHQIIQSRIKVKPYKKRKVRIVQFVYIKMQIKVNSFVAMEVI